MRAPYTVSRLAAFAAAAGLALAAAATFAQQSSAQHGSGQSGNAPSPAIDTATAEAIKAAIEALNAGKYAEAQAAIAALKLDNLSPYSRSEIEWILFSIAYEQEKYAEAREHLESAITAGGLDLMLLNEVPYRCAQVLETAIDRKTVNLKEKLYDKLANCWIAAGELDRALAPLLARTPFRAYR
jgi:hypothetical protein